MAAKWTIFATYCELVVKIEKCQLFTLVVEQTTVAIKNATLVLPTTKNTSD